MPDASSCPKPAWPFTGMPQLPPPKPDTWQSAPTVEDCHALWDRHHMLPNVREHSTLVAHIATELAQRAASLGVDVNPAAVKAAGLLHDIAKTWCVAHGGSHDLIGASWTIQETGHFGVAQGVILHVHWPWPLPQGRDICQLPIFILYADKRVRHNQCVTLAERFDDLLARYGKTGRAREGIRQSFEQAKKIELALSKQLNRDLHEDSFDCGRLVKRA